MLDDDTIEVMLGPGTMPGTEDTRELPKVIAFGASALGLPPHLADDPILTMPAPTLSHPSLFDHTFGHRPAFHPARPMKSPRMPIRPRDHLVAALGAGVIVLSVATVVLVESGWNSGLPRSEQERLRQEQSVSIAPSPVISQGPATSSPSAIPRHIRQAPPVPVSASRRIPATQEPSASPRVSHSPSVSPTGPKPSSSPSAGSSPSPAPTSTPTTSTPTPGMSLPVVVVLPTLPHPLVRSSSPIAPSS